MRKSKEELLWDREVLQASESLELRLQPVSIDPAHWSERAKLESRWKAFNLLSELPEHLH